MKNKTDSEEILSKNNLDKHEEKPKIYLLDGKEVSKSNFEKLKSKLKISDNGTCARTIGGGFMSYSAIDPKNKNYTYHVGGDKERNFESIDSS